MSTTPAHWTLIGAQEALARGEVSSVELTRALLERAHRLNGAINCYLRIDDEAALAEAAAADAVRASGRSLGPLHGVPFAAKDLYYDAARVTNCGSRVRQGYRPARTATVLERLRAAGAVNLGALNMTEFALGPTGHNAHWGACRNPWNLAHVAGGSSSGSGAAVAARLAYASLGSDTGGSIRIPAAVNGVIGLKPTYARVSRAGVMRLSPSMDHVGPLARTARDCARLLRVIAGHDPLDSTSSRRAVPDYEAEIEQGIAGVRIGVPRQYYFENVAPDVKSALDAALRALGSLGARIVDVDVPESEHLTELSRVVVYSEATALHSHWLRSQPEDYSAQVRVRASTGLAIPAASYLEALQLRPLLLRRFVERVYRQCDVLCTPTLVQPVPTLAETDVGGGAAMWPIIAALVQNTAPFNYLGVPVLSVPVGFTRNGLPASCQLVGRPFAEGLLLRVAAAYQSVTDWHERVPPTA
ncbi:MAG: amidase [Pseudomonadota bacterium]